MITRRFEIYEKRCKRLNLLAGDNKFSSSHGIAFAYFLFNKVKISPWLKLWGDWSNYQSQINSSFMTSIQDLFAGKFERLYLKEKENN